MLSRILFALALLSSSALFITGRAAAACPVGPGIPCGTTSTVPCGINLVGSTGGVIDPLGTFTITVRDFAGAPVVGADVWLDFTRCCFDTRLTAPQPGLVAALKEVHAFSGPGGVAVFRIMGFAGGGAPIPMAGCANVFASTAVVPPVLFTDFVDHNPVQVGSFDLNGALGPAAFGVSPADLSIWLADFFSAPPSLPRSDYDFRVLCAQSIGPADLAEWLNVIFSGGSTTNGPGILPCP